MFSDTARQGCGCTVKPTNIETTNSKKKGKRPITLSTANLHKRANNTSSSFASAAAAYAFQHHFHLLAIANTTCHTYDRHSFAAYAFLAFWSLRKA
jgi:hypothetical protein